MEKAIKFKLCESFTVNKWISGLWQKIFYMKSWNMYISELEICKLEKMFPAICKYLLICKI